MNLRKLPALILSPLRQYRVRVALGLLVLLAAGCPWPTLGPALGIDVRQPIRVALVLGLSVGFLIVYGPFLPSLGRLLAKHLGLTILLAMLFALIDGLILTSYGVPDLFWNERLDSRILAAMAATVTLGVFGLLAYYFDPTPALTFRRLRAFRHAWWGREDVRGRPKSGLPGRAERNARRAELLLRSARLPFLTLLALPALYPSLFPGVPRSGPTRLGFGLEGPKTLLLHPDVTHSPWAWALGLSAWLIGIVLGVAFVKVAVRVAPLAQGPLRLAGGLFPNERARRRARRIVFAVAAIVALVLYRHGMPEDPLAGWLLVVTCAFVVIGFVAVQEGARQPPPSDLNHGHDTDRPDEREEGFRRFLLMVTGIELMLTLFVGVFRFIDFSVKRELPWLAWVPLALIVLPALPAFLRGLDPKHRLWGLFSLLMSGTFLLAYLMPPGAAVCALIVGLAVIVAWFSRLEPRSRVYATLAFFAWIALMNADPYKLRFDHLDYRSDRRVPLDPIVHDLYDVDHAPPRPKADPDLISNDEALLAWWRRQVRPVRFGPYWTLKQPKLAVVCVTGGATRAGYWSAVVLDRLRTEIGEFPEHLRIITGASGGMVGAAHFVRWLDRRTDPTQPDARTAEDRDWVDAMPSDSLVPVARNIALENLWLMLLPRLPNGLEVDRGQVLEWDWIDLDIPIRNLRARERRGELPSLIFSPMIVDDGRRMLISNLDLADLALSKGRALGPGGSSEAAFSLSALEFFKLFPGSASQEFRLATAVRMSATFPFASPAVNLPTQPPLRLVDAGYYDNYGVNLAAAWIARNRQWLETHTSGIVVVQARAFTGRGDRLGMPATNHPPSKDGQPAPTRGSLGFGLQLLTTPGEALGSAYSTAAVFRNDQDLAALSDLFRRTTGRSDFFTTVILENTAEVQVEAVANEDEPQPWPGLGLLGGPSAQASAILPPPQPESANTEVSMTWTLTRAEKRAMKVAIPRPIDSTTAQRLNRNTNLFWPPPRVRPPDTAQETGLDPLTRLEHIRRLLEDLEAHPEPGRRQTLRKALERALNYERIQALKAWWTKG